MICNKVKFFLMLCAGILPLHACGNAPLVGVSLDDVEIKMNSARALSCVDSCSKIVFDMAVENKTDSAICFSARYIGRDISNSVFITSIDGKESYSYQVSEYSDDGSGADNPSNGDRHASMLRSGPNIYLRPHSKLTYTVDTGDKYSIPNIPAKVQVAMYFYPCDEAQFENYHYVRKTPGAFLHFESFQPKAQFGESGKNSVVEGNSPIN